MACARDVMAKTITADLEMLANISRLRFAGFCFMLSVVGSMRESRMKAEVQTY